MNVNFSQLKPISSLPRKYSQYVKQAKRDGAVIFMKKNKPETALVDFKLWQKLEMLQRKLEEKDALNTIAQSEADIKAGKIIKLESLQELC